MSQSDPIADYLTCIRNAGTAKKKRLDVPSSKMKHSLTQILERENLIRGYKVIEDDKQHILRIYLKYTPKDEPIIQGLKRISTPGRRVYVGRDELPRVMGGLGFAVLSTPSGLLVDREARRLGVGGEVICKVW